MILHSHLRLQSHSHRCACARMLAHVFCSSMPLYATVRTRAQCVPVASMLFALTGCGMPSHVHMLLCVFPGTLVSACVLVCLCSHLNIHSQTLLLVAHMLMCPLNAFSCPYMLHALLTLVRTHSFEHYFHLCIFVCACVPMCTHAHI